MLFGKASCDWLIVGLGNPGREYESSRHNSGFLAIDRLAAQLGVKIDRAKFHGLTAMATWQGQKLCLLKPDTFMNNSGQAVQPAAAFYKIPPERILVLFDDISLSVGRIRVRPDGSAGGHNGIKSIIAQLGTQNFPRVKIGVDPKPRPDYDLADWVLGTVPKAQQPLFSEALSHAANAALAVVRDGVTAAANAFNGK
ncbi:MAG: aminoacyl-tRNA hydrolase [Oscillospiraceae bacterium]|nr:aminoacyl-tRNA hydrolase [Oscillospiraceae bacterium]